MREWREFVAVKMTCGEYEKEEDVGGEGMSQRMAGWRWMKNGMKWSERKEEKRD